MISTETLEKLAEAAGEGSLVNHEAVRVDDVPFTVTLCPESPEALGRTLSTLDACGVGVLVRGGGSHLGFGNPPRDVEVMLSTQRIAGVLELDAGDGVCRAAAGTTLSSLRAEANASGWELPLDASGAAASVGGVLAAAAIGPRALGYGLPRDNVLGIEVALANGDRTHCGGRVVKNVTGYDLNKLYIGSLGTLGVIEAAWLRLRPMPAAVRVSEVQLESLPQAISAGIEISRVASARAVVLHHLRGEDVRLVVELAGDEPTVRRDERALASTARFVAAAPDALDDLRRQQASLPGDAGTRFRLAALPTRLGPLANSLADHASELLVQPGLGLLYAGFAASETGGLERVARAASAVGASWLLEAAPASVKQECDVFGDDRAALALTRALKNRFDPAGRLNPGRFMGRL